MDVGCRDVVGIDPGASFLWDHSMKVSSISGSMLEGLVVIFFKALYV